MSEFGFNPESHYPTEKIGWDDFELDRITLERKPALHAGTQEFTGQEDVVCADLVLTINQERWEHTPDGVIPSWSVRFFVEHDNAILLEARVGTHEIVEEELVGSTRRLDTIIERIDQNNVLPPRFGIRFYEKMLDYIQARARADAREYVHHVERAEMGESGKSPLSAERWNSLFVPLLESRGYDKESEGHWYKAYQPSK